MNAYRKIKFYSPGQILATWAGILATAAAMLAVIIIFI